MVATKTSTKILSAAGVLVGGGVLMIIVMVGPLWLMAGMGRVQGVEVAYISGTANVRECPNKACRSSETYKTGQQVEVVRVVNGERLPNPPESKDGTSDQWYEIRYGDETRYVHTSFVAASPIVASGYFWALGGILSSLVFLGLYKLVGWSPLMTVAAARQRGTDRLLFLVVLSAGLAAGIIGFVYSQLNNEGIASFLASTFVNLGSGFVGAAITFVLFQSLLTKRTGRDESIEELRQEFASLRIEITDLVGPQVDPEDDCAPNPGDTSQQAKRTSVAANANTREPLPSTAAVILVAAGFLAGMATALRRSHSRQP